MANIKMKVVAIIQARMSSSRLPGKTLLPLAGRPAIQHVIERVKMISGIDEVIVSTSISQSDNMLADFCASIKIPVFRGSEEDVLDRYYQTSLHCCAELILRITGDCPLLDPIESGKVLKKSFETGSDYISNIHPPMLPDGLDTEVIKFEALEKAWEASKKKSEREHVTLYLYSNPNLFSVSSLTYKDDFSHYRLTLDEQSDYLLLQNIFTHLQKTQKFGYLHEVINILENNPEILELNKTIKRNEGLELSLKRERIRDL